LLNYVLSNLSQIQKKWIYLQPIFSNGAFKNGESSFKRIDKDFRFLMRNISSNQKVVSLVKISNIEMIIESSMNQLNQCQNTLSKYMTEKRDLFPRFYFLSDDDLLEILGQSEKDNILQKHINKLFPGINKLILSNSEEKNFLRIKGMMSTGGDEYIQLSNEVLMDEVVEKSLTKLENEIKKTLKSLVYQCFHQNDMSSIDSIEKFPMQVLCLIKSVQFTSNIEKSISTMSLQNLLLNIKSEISNYSFMLQKTANQVTQMKIRALLIDLVHQVTTVEYLLKHNVTDQSDWHWLQQIKFYFNSRNELITIKMVKAEFEYSYEFLGLYNKLVYTALTHNCYLTLTQAMVLGLGGNPFGQAGTGKTEW
jgi:dynein heavy chain 2, cytosolic